MLLLIRKQKVFRLQIGTVAFFAEMRLDRHFLPLGDSFFGTTIGFVGAFAIGGGVAVLVGVTGAVAIYYLGEGADSLYEKFKEWLFE